MCISMRQCRMIDLPLPFSPRHLPASPLISSPPSLFPLPFPLPPPPSLFPAFPPLYPPPLLGFAPCLPLGGCLGGGPGSFPVFLLTGAAPPPAPLTACSVQLELAGGIPLFWYAHEAGNFIMQLCPSEALHSPVLVASIMQNANPDSGMMLSQPQLTANCLFFLVTNVA